MTKAVIKRGRHYKSDVLAITNEESSKSDQHALNGIEELTSKSEHRAEMLILRDEVYRLHDIVKAMKVNEGAKRSAKDKAGTDEGGAIAACVLDVDDASSSSSLPSEEKKLRRLVAELAIDVKQRHLDIDLISGKMKLVAQMWHEVMVDEMRNSLKDVNGNAVETLERIELNEKDLIAEMDRLDIKNVSIAEYKKKPEQPKGCSRGVWMEHLKMSKKFADCVAHICCVHRSGNVDSIDWKPTQASLALVEEWMHKWLQNEPMMKEIEKVVNYEIIRRVQDYEYFNCLFCNTVDFSVKHFLGHFASGNHHMKAMEMADMDSPKHLFGFASNFITNLTELCFELHGSISAQFTTPLVKSGAKAPQASPDSIPSVAFLSIIELRYGKKINGDYDSAKLKDPVYVASLLPEIIKNHKSDLGKKLFKDLHEYLGTGKSFYCNRCKWKVTNRDSYYRHILNPFHISMNYLEDGRQFNLLTVSINVHMRDDN